MNHFELQAGGWMENTSVLQQIADIVIVGGGPAGLATAMKLAENPDCRIILLERGKIFEDRLCPADLGRDCPDCKICDVISGLGGASTIFGGKICQYPAGSGLDVIGATTDLNELLSEAQQESIEVLNFLEATESKIRVIEPGRYVPPEGEFVFKFYNANVIPQLGMRAAFTKLISTLAKRNVTIKSHCEVDAISRDSSGAFLIDVIEKGVSKRYASTLLVLATGRAGMPWFARTVLNLGLETIRNSFDIGIRLETRRDVFDEFASLTADPKYKLRQDCDEVRTFCACIGGKITLARLKGVSIIDGHFGDAPTQNANIAIVNRVGPSPDIDTLDSAIQFAHTLNIRGKPLVQRLDHFMSGKPSTTADIEGSSIKPTMRFFGCGNISELLPNSVRQSVYRGIDLLETVFPGLQDGENLVYAPVIDRYWDRVVVDSSFATNVKNLYVVGDAAGYARGVLQAVWSGLSAARGIEHNFRQEVRCGQDPIHSSLAVAQ
jgi:hypothetical protein